MNKSELKDELARLSKLYYEGESEITDEEFDTLQGQYLALGGEETVGHGYVPSTNAFVHTVPMESLKKIKNNLDELLAWMKTMQDIHASLRSSGPLVFSVSPKFDGLALAIYVEGGKIVRAVTRGDGTTGEDVTATALLVPDIVDLISRGDGVYTGEVQLPVENLALANFMRGTDEAPFKQLRNASAGIIRRQSHYNDIPTLLSFSDHNSGQYVERMSFMNDNDMETRVHSIIRSYEEKEGIFTKSEGIHVETDGVVFKVENTDVRSHLGSSSGSPKWARAYKFNDETYSSVVENVIWNVPGKIGRLTPVVVYKDILINGGVYNKATVHNYARFIDLDIHKNDTLTMKKSGDVIPFVVDIQHNENMQEKFQAPQNCPSCNTQLIVDGKFLVCPAPRETCDPGLGLTFMLSALGIKGYKETTVKKIYETVAEKQDLLHALNTIRLSPDGAIAQIDGLGNKTEQSLKNSLNKAWSETELWQWIYSMNMSRVGRSVSKALVNTYESIPNIIEAIDDDSLARNVRLLTGVNWEHIKNSRDQFVRLHKWLLEAGVTVSATTVPQQQVSDSMWTGQKVVITGTLTKPRKEVEEWFIAHGATVQKALSSTTDILLDGGDGTSTKSKKAHQLKKRIITGQEFQKLFEE